MTSSVTRIIGGVSRPILPAWFWGLELTRGGDDGDE